MHEYLSLSYDNLHEKKGSINLDAPLLYKLFT